MTATRSELSIQIFRRCGCGALPWPLPSSAAARSSPTTLTSANPSSLAAPTMPMLHLRRHCRNQLVALTAVGGTTRPSEDGLTKVLKLRAIGLRRINLPLLKVQQFKYRNSLNTMLFVILRVICRPELIIE